MSKYHRNYNSDGNGSTNKVTEHSDGSKTIEQYKSHHMAGGIHISDGPKTVTEIDPDGNEVE